MAFPFKNILCAIDFDDNSLAALDSAAQIAHQNDGTVYLLHIVPMIVTPAAMPVYVDLYKGQEEVALAKLHEIVKKHLSGLKYKLIAHLGETAATILKAARQIPADVLVIGTHGRRGFSRFFLGSIAEIVLRGASCPVLVINHRAADKDLVGTWMTKNPITASPKEYLSAIRDKMSAGGFRTIPIVEGDRPVGMISDRDVRQRFGHLEDIDAEQAMNGSLISVAPWTSVHEAARLLRERKIGGLPVVEDDKLVGIITTTDVLAALTEQP